MYTKILLFCISFIFANSSFLSASTSFEAPDKNIDIARLQFSANADEKEYHEKITHSLQKIKNQSKLYEEYMITLTGDTSCGDEYEEYASQVEDTLMDAGINPQNIQTNYFRSKEVPSDCTKSRSVNIKLALYNLINQDKDDDGVANSKDKCPKSKKNSIVSADGCVHNTSAILLAGRKTHTAIIVATKKGSTKISKPLELVTLSSNAAISEPREISLAELQAMIPNLLENSNQKQYKFVFYFTKNKLTKKSKDTIDAMLDTLDELNDPYINIVGNTDTIGTVEENKALGLKRAKVIEALIKRAKIRYLKIDISSNSELNLAVPTADETAKIQNRRVDVLIQ